MRLTSKLAVAFGLFFVIAAPMLQPVSHAPSPPAYSNAIATVLWGVLIVVVGVVRLVGGGKLTNAFLATPIFWILIAVSLIALSIFVHLAIGRYGYFGVSAQGIASLLLAIGVMVAGWYSGAAKHPIFSPYDIAWAVMLCGVASALLGWIQYFGLHQPDWWLNPLREMGRVYANLRQPNLLAQVLCLAICAAVWLRLQNRLPKAWAVLTLLILVPAVTFTGSRMGVLMLILLIPLMLWAASQRRRAVVLVLSPLLIYVATWWVLDFLDHSGGFDFYGASRLNEGADATGLRWPLWLNSLDLSFLHPWLGCGFQQFNYCFVHAELSERAPANFNHAHNLVLNLLVELGWPVGVLVTGFLALAFWQLRPLRNNSASSLYFSLIALATVHALLEFPWWHVYFLLPVAFIVGVASIDRSRGFPSADVSYKSVPVLSKLLFSIGVFGVLAGVYVGWSYHSLLPVYMSTDKKITATEGLRRGVNAVLFQDHVEYSLAMAVSDGVSSEKMKDVLTFFHQSSRGHMDSKFLLRYAQVAWIAGEADFSRHLLWRAIQIDPEVADEAKVALQLSDHPSLQLVVDFVRNPYPVNLPLAQIESLR